jgi:predicted RNA-binding protein
MSRQEIEMSDVVIVLVSGHGANMVAILESLKPLGLSITEFDVENDVIEGTCESSRVLHISKHESVKYVRAVFTWFAEIAVPGSEPDDADDGGEDDYEASSGG